MVPEVLLPAVRELPVEERPGTGHLRVGPGTLRRVPRRSELKGEAWI